MNRSLFFLFVSSHKRYHAFYKSGCFNYLLSEILAIKHVIHGRWHGFNFSCDSFGTLNFYFIELLGDRLGTLYKNSP